jgi:dGTPase
VPRSARAPPAGTRPARTSRSWSFDGTLADQAALKGLTSALIGRLCRSAQHATAAAYGARPSGEADLVVPARTRLECALLKGITAHYVMCREEHNANQARQRELVAELAALITLGAPATLEPALRPAFEKASDDAARTRVIIDQLASLTDTSATAWHARLTARA